MMDNGKKGKMVRVKTGHGRTCHQCDLLTELSYPIKNKKTKKDISTFDKSAINFHYDNCVQYLLKQLSDICKLDLEQWLHNQNITTLKF